MYRLASDFMLVVSPFAAAAQGGIFAAPACGVYGDTTASVANFGLQANPSTLTLNSPRTSPIIGKRNTDMLEVLSQEQFSVGR